MSEEQPIDLGYRPRAWQDDCHRLRRTKPPGCLDWRGYVELLVLVVHRRAGKTVWCLMELLDAALSHPTRDGRFAYIAPELKQAKRNAWDYLKRYATLVPGCEVKEGELYVQFPNGSRISLYGADNPDSLRGIYLDGAVLDEVAQMKPDTWEAVVQIALMDRKGWAVFIGTVKGEDLLSRMYFVAKRDRGGTMAAALYTAHQTEVFTEQEIEAKRAGMSEAHFRREFMCDFSAGGEDQLCPGELIEEAMARAPRRETLDFAAKVLGVDVAFAPSGDRSVIYPRQGLMTFEPQVYRGIDNMSLAARVAEKWSRWGADACFIDIGRGEGVVSRLRQLGFDPTPVNFGGKPLDMRYVNKKAEMYFQVREYLLEGGALPARQDLREDLAGLRVDYSKRTDRIEVVYDESLPSPDEAAALSLTFAYPVFQPARDEHDALTRLAGTQARVKVDDDSYYRIG
jgi:hypothetical protein